MPKPKIKRSELEEASCPACQGKGRQPALTTQGDDPLCQTCKGLGWVLPNAVCVCGRSPNYLGEFGLYCGLQACLDVQKANASAS